MKTKTMLVAMTCLCAFNSLQGNAQVAGSNNPVVVAAEVTLWLQLRLSSEESRFVTVS